MIANDNAELINACLADLFKCPEQVVKRLPAHAVRRAIDVYKGGLRKQAAGKWQSLPKEFINEFQSSFPTIDLKAIRYATEIDTVHGQAITFANEIFFPKYLNISGYDDKKLMLHELKHTVQYAAKGGEAAFISEYLLHSTGQAITRGSLNIHDYLPVEQDAMDYSTELMNKYGWQLFFQNGCPRQSVRLAVFYQNASTGTWDMRGWFKFAPNEADTLAHDGKALHTLNSYLYFYAVADDGSHTPGGDTYLTINGEQFPFLQWKAIDKFYARMAFGC